MASNLQLNKKKNQKEVKTIEIITPWICSTK